MVNPTKYVRAGIISTLNSAGITVPIYEERVPKNVIPHPNLYILLTSPGKVHNVQSKNEYEWLANVNVDINKVNPQGYAVGGNLEDLVGQVMTAIENVSFPVFGAPKNRYHMFVNEQPFTVETDTMSIQRRVLTYQFWLKKA